MYGHGFIALNHFGIFLFKKEWPMILESLTLDHIQRTYPLPNNYLFVRLQKFYFILFLCF